MSQFIKFESLTLQFTRSVTNQYHISLFITARGGGGEGRIGGEGGGGGGGGGEGGQDGGGVIISTIFHFLSWVRNPFHCRIS